MFWLEYGNHCLLFTIMYYILTYAVVMCEIKLGCIKIISAFVDVRLK